VDDLQPRSINSPVKRRTSSSRSNTLTERFLFTFGTQKEFRKLTKATQNLFAYISTIIVGVAGIIALVASILGWWR
jgi:hypothetical protein